MRSLPSTGRGLRQTTDRPGDRSPPGRSQQHRRPDRTREAGGGQGRRHERDRAVPALALRRRRLPGTRRPDPGRGRQHRGGGQALLHAGGRGESPGRCRRRARFEGSPRVRPSAPRTTTCAANSRRRSIARPAPTSTCSSRKRQWRQRRMRSPSREHTRRSSTAACGSGDRLQGGRASRGGPVPTKRAASPTGAPAAAHPGGAPRGDSSGSTPSSSWWARFAELAPLPMELPSAPAQELIRQALAARPEPGSAQAAVGAAEFTVKAARVGPLDSPPWPRRRSWASSRRAQRLPLDVRRLTRLLRRVRRRIGPGGLGRLRPRARAKARLSEAQWNVEKAKDSIARQVVGSTHARPVRAAEAADADGERGPRRGRPGARPDGRPPAVRGGIVLERHPGPAGSGAGAPGLCARSRRVQQGPIRPLARARPAADRRAESPAPPVQP